MWVPEGQEGLEGQEVGVWSYGQATLSWSQDAAVGMKVWMSRTAPAPSGCLSSFRPACLSFLSSQPVTVVGTYTLALELKDCENGE